MSVTDLGSVDMEQVAYRNQLFIGGAWRDGAEGATIDVINPSDGSLITTVSDATVEDARTAVDAAASAAEEWAGTLPRERGEVLRHCFELIRGRADDLAHLIALENGKALGDARGEVAYAAEFFRWYSEESVRILGEVSRAPSGSNRILVQHRPIGVSVLVTPWNFPAAMATRKLAPALAAGCTTVLKPATLTPLTALAIAELMADAGVPAGVVNVITTTQTGPAVSAMLCDDRVRKLSFTGSTEVGRVLLKDAAEQILSCSMELGGNAPFIVFEDADLQRALDGLMIAKMRNGGQACTAANRIYVQRPILKEFERRLAERMAALAVGPGPEPTTECGPLVDAPSVAEVERLVVDALDRGARLLTGGEALDRPGFYYTPTVLSDVPADAAIVEEEIFGPVASLIPFDAEDEAVAGANQTALGLAAYVYTSDLARGLAIAERLESGMVAINRGLVSDPAAPFGGVKQSGLGREGAHHGMLEFCEPQYVAVEW